MRLHKRCRHRPLPCPPSNAQTRQEQRSTVLQQGRSQSGRKHALNRPSHRRRKAKRRRLLRDQGASSSELFDWKRLQGLSEEGIESLLKEFDASDDDNTEAVTESYSHC